MNRLTAFKIQNYQRGAALLTGLIFMVILTLLGITAARMAGLEERMSGNLRDRAIAMQAAELTLRHAEQDILTTGRVASQNFQDTCPNGLCYNGRSGDLNGTNWNTTPIWTLVSMTAAPSVGYGQILNPPAVAINGVSAMPRYLIEAIPKRRPGEPDEEIYYRITVRALGANPNTVVWLQEVFKP